MELSEYISTVIEQVCQGVLSAQRKCGVLDAIVNPRVTIGESGEYYIPINANAANFQRRVQSIEIEAALVEGNTLTQSGNAGLNVSFAAGKLGKETGRTTSTTNRVKFSIPICLPTSDAL